MDPVADNKALVLFSGGQDSTVCLAWALEGFDHVETIGFSYGQRHAVEMERRLAVRDALRDGFPGWAARLGDDHVVDASVLGALADTALTDDRAIALQADGLPNTFVPGRNLAFFTFAAATGYRRGLSHLVGGMGEADFSGYPDCRDDTLKSLQVTLGLGMGRRFIIHTPLMWRDKAAIWALSHDLGGDAFVDLVVEATHTCYAGDRATRHPWGYGCGECPACELRARGWERWREGGPA
mgnify:CR=1 FL=1